MLPAVDLRLTDLHFFTSTLTESQMVIYINWTIEATFKS